MPSRTRFKGTLRPDLEVVAVLERALQAARGGHIKAISLVLVTQANLIEEKAAGDLSEHRVNALLAGLARSSYYLLTDGDPIPPPLK